jgi:hypothetical protein
VVAGVIGRLRWIARDITTPVPRERIGATAGRFDRGRRRVSAGRNPGLTTGACWIARVSRIVICLPSNPGFFALVFECTRSGVRLIEHVIELLPNNMAAHRQISAAEAGNPFERDTPRTHV